MLGRVAACAAVLFVWPICTRTSDGDGALALAEIVMVANQAQTIADGRHDAEAEKQPQLPQESAALAAPGALVRAAEPSAPIAFHNASAVETEPFGLDAEPLMDGEILAKWYGVESQIEEENQVLRTELGRRYQVLGASVPMKALRQQIAVTAPTNGRVLIYGESGTGKELVARTLHATSLRSKGPFVEVNCAAIPDELIESELFGHLKGSFTGATDDKVGKFQKADGGTLFLDEIGDMSLRTQSKVLRALEEQRIEPVGSNQSVNVDVRVIAATNKNLEQEIARGAFRQDLFYRLNVIPFFVPPLRDRLQDIPVLARHFLNEFSAAYGKKPRELSETAMDILIRYPWPGNVRELRNLVERLVIVCPQTRIEPHHLPPELFRGVAEAPQHPYSTLHEARSAYEREFILRKLQENRWNMTQTASALGLERSHLYRKMKSLGIAAPD